MLRSFGFTIAHENLLCHEDDYLDNALIELQTCGCKVINVWRTELDQYDCPKHFKSVQYTFLVDDGCEHFKKVVITDGSYFGNQRMPPKLHPEYSNFKA